MQKKQQTVSSVPSSLGLLYMKDVNGLTEIHNIHLLMLSEDLKVITVLECYGLFSNVESHINGYF